MIIFLLLMKIFVKSWFKSVFLLSYPFYLYSLFVF